MKIPIAMLLVFFTFSSYIGSAYEYTGPEAELVELINEERKAVGSPPLTVDWEVTRLARLKTEEMKIHKHFDHESLAYGSPSQLLDRFGIVYTIAGANIAMGQETPKGTLDAWLKSESHYENLVDPRFTSAGVGLSWDDDNIPYWTLLLLAESTPQPLQ